MMYEIDKKEIEEALHRICVHPLFANSSTYPQLLHYLVEKALANEDLKEYTIGADLFGKNYMLNKNDGKVRSYMYKLRKKLAEYYAKEGAKEKIVFNIKKGQYNISFEPPQNEVEQHDKLYIKIPAKPLKWTALAFAVILLSALAVFKLANQPSDIWQPFFNTSSKNLVVLSDQYVVNEQLTDGKLHGVLYPEINSDNDFLTYTQKSPEKNLRTADYTLFSKMAPYSIKTISEWFIVHQSDYDLALESKLTYKDIQENNILFVGQFKTMNLSESLFLKDSKVFTTYRDGFKYKDKQTDKIYNTQHKKNGKVEYAMVSFTSLSPNQYALYFVSNNDIGVMATLRNFTDKKWLDEFKQNLHSEKTFFNALFEVSGLQRTDMSCKLVELEIVE